MIEMFCIVIQISIKCGLGNCLALNMRQPITSTNGEPVYSRNLASLCHSELMGIGIPWYSDYTLALFRNPIIFIHETPFENVICKTVAI